MKNKITSWMKLSAGIVLGLVIIMTAFGCKSTGPRLTEPNGAFLSALADNGVELEAGSAIETAAVQGVIDLFADFSHDNVSEMMPKVYAEKLFFRDGFKEFHALAPLTEYMVESTKPLRKCVFTFEKPIRDGRDHYLRWTMIVSLKRDKEQQKEDRVLGMSHIRFDETGKVVFQQDYWDPTDVLYRRIPLAGWMIDKVKARL
jgi:hypothetical protein